MYFVKYPAGVKRMFARMRENLVLVRWLLYIRKSNIYKLEARRSRLIPLLTEYSSTEYLQLGCERFSTYFLFCLRDTRNARSDPNFVLTRYEMFSSYVMKMRDIDIITS